MSEDPSTPADGALASMPSGTAAEAISTIRLFRTGLRDVSNATENLATLAAMRESFQTSPLMAGTPEPQDMGQRIDDLDQARIKAWRDVYGAGRAIVLLLAGQDQDQQRLLMFLANAKYDPNWFDYLDQMTAELAAELLRREMVGSEKSSGPMMKRTAGHRRRRQVRAKRLTARQVEAMEAFGECEGNYSAGAKRMGIGVSAFRQHVEAAQHKLGRDIVKRATTQSLPSDRRGGSAIAAGPFPEAQGNGKSRSGHDRRKD